VVAVLGIGSVWPAHADLISFDPNGGAGGPGVLQVSAFDEKVGNAVSLGAIAAIPTGATFQTLYQATIATLIGSSGGQIASPGLNGVNYLTIIAGFNETATVKDANTINLNSNVNQGNSFVEIYSSSSAGPAPSDLNGTGFRNGNLILKGTANFGAVNTGSFSTTPAAVQQFDQFGANDYGTTNSVVGQGATRLSFHVDSFDPNYFKTAITTFSFNTSNVVPFDSTDPSKMFYSIKDTGPPLNGSPSRGDNAGTAPNFAPVLGNVNGLNGTDFQFQTDANSSFTAAVPEPNIIVMSLSGVGFACVAGLRQMRRRRKLSAA